MKTIVYKPDGTTYEIDAPEIVVPTESEPDTEPTADELLKILAGVSE